MLTLTRSETAHLRIWFGDPDRPLAGWLSVPAGSGAPDGPVEVVGGVVLCPPMGEEGRSAHRTYRRLAESLAERGFVALRFDYDGTGDSAGAMADPDRVEAWLAGVVAAHDHLRGLGVHDVAAVGMRLGATLAASAPVQSTDLRWSSLVLWDPCVSGRLFLRESEALHAFGDDAAPEDDGLRHTPGFQYDAATATALRGLDLTRLPRDRPLAARVLLLLRDDRPVPPSLVDRLALEGDALTASTAHDQHLLLDLKPSDGQVPLRAVADIVDWLAAAAPAEPYRLDLPADLPALVGRADPGVVLPAVPPEGGPAVAVRERAVTLGEVGLAGVVVEPADGSAADRPWVVMPNVAAEHHIGPGRRWVEFARAWAAQGHRCVRVDHSGIGDSPTRPGEREDTTFAPEWVADMSDLMTALRADGSRVVFVALCSGAYTAFEAALAAEVDAVFAINPRLTLWEVPVDLAAREVRRAAVVPPALLFRVRDVHPVVASGWWRIWRQLAAWRAPYRIVHRVLRRGTTVELVVCHDDGKHFTEVAAWWPVRWWDQRRGRLRLEEDDVYDHSLLTRRAQEQIFVRATAFLERHSRA
ncbi:alpha/beta hydrolase [Nocardioides rubriscoriae]|uniref:alpha/beta hydrolase n=1 Tax=Nocardioides rubriscoriae TaxID=642762 RepID=UPI0011E023CC|nr:alpha/beta hydrolase [Nocardioides rubriscoriae]